MTADQTQAVYAAEDLWEKRESRARIRFGDWNEVWPFYWDLAERCRDAGVADVSPPAVKERKGALQAHYNATDQTVYMPSYRRGGAWALNTATAIHEFAHHLSPGQGHGPAFRAAMIDCLGALGWNPDLLAECYAEVGLTTTDKGDGITDKVGKLLTHAEKAGTEAERLTYLEKAEGLAAQHSINLALVRKTRADNLGHQDRPITSEMFSLAALPNVTNRNLAVELASGIARAHGAQCSIRGKSMYMTFYGFPEDVHLTELMINRITPMMFEEARRYLASPEHRESGVATVSARITFCNHFAYEVYRRLCKAVKEAEEKAVAQEEPGTPGTELALRQKEIEVRDYADYEFKRQGIRGSWRGSKSGSWAASAAEAGSSAAKNANLYGRKELS